MQNLPKDESLVKLGEMVPAKFEEYLLQYNDVIEVNIKTSDALLNQMLDINVLAANSNRMMMGGGFCLVEIFFI